MTLNEERIAYFQEIGRALTAWADFELTLMAVVGMFFRPEERTLMNVSYAKMEGFRIKLNFANAILLRGLPAALHEEWGTLHDQMRRFSQIRNDLAHRHTKTYPTATEGCRFALVPATFPKGSPKDRPYPGSLCLREIIKNRNEFVALIARLSNFACRAVEVTEQFPKSDEQAENPPPLHQIARQMHEELGHPHQSSQERRREESARNAAASLEYAKEVLNDQTSQTP